MANTYTQLYVQLVFSPLRREAMIGTSWKDRLEKYICGIIRNKGHKLIAINCMPDHAHIFLGLNPDEALSDLVRDVKRDSTTFVNAEIQPRGKFAWQEGFGAFSYSHSQIDRVARYVLDQEEHHKRRSFRDEYEALLLEFAVRYEQRFLFRWLDADEQEPAP
jgi:putative transposase